MIARWNAIVTPEDTIYHLGDVAMHTAPMKRILPRLNGKKILIIGNHDLLYDYFIKTRGQKFIDKMYKEYKEAGFTEIYKSGMEHCLFDEYGRNYHVRLSHFPTINAYDNYHGTKHDHARPEDTGILNICGHVHQNWLKRGNNVNVGVDVHDFKPISLEAVLQLYNNGPKDIDNPNKIRVFIWKIYHTTAWRISNIINACTKLFRNAKLKLS